MTQPTDWLEQAKREIDEELDRLNQMEHNLILRRHMTNDPRRLKEKLYAERARNLELRHDYALEVKAKTAANEENRRLQSEIRRLHETVTQLKARTEP